MREFRKKSLFRRFFKRAWKRQFTIQQHLRSVVAIIKARGDEWQRMRYQREFESVARAFGKWTERVQERRRLIGNYNALSHYRSTLIIKAF